LANKGVCSGWEFESGVLKEGKGTLGFEEEWLFWHDVVYFWLWVRGLSCISFFLFVIVFVVF